MLEKQARQVDTTPSPRASAITDMDEIGLRPSIYIATPRRCRFDLQRQGRVEAAQRPGDHAVEETWPAQAGYDEDGAGGDGVSG